MHDQPLHDEAYEVRGGPKNIINLIWVLSLHEKDAVFCCKSESSLSSRKLSVCFGFHFYN